MYIIDLPPWTVVQNGHMLSFKEIIILIVRSVVWVTLATHKSFRTQLRTPIETTQIIKREKVSVLPAQ